MFVDDYASSYMIVATVANSWFTHEDPANVTQFSSLYARHKLLTKSIKKGFDNTKGNPATHEQSR